jgi:hypothetical protein
MRTYFLVVALYAAPTWTIQVLQSMVTLALALAMVRALPSNFQFARSVEE